MRNAREELIGHVEGRAVKRVRIRFHGRLIDGTLEEVLPQLDFTYCYELSGGDLSGTIWYVDGTWSDRDTYDGSAWWEHRVCPPIDESLADKIRYLNSEVDCRIQHGAESGGHLEYVREQLVRILESVGG